STPSGGPPWTAPSSSPSRWTAGHRASPCRRGRAATSRSTASSRCACSGSCCCTRRPPWPPWSRSPGACAPAPWRRCMAENPQDRAETRAEAPAHTDAPPRSGTENRRARLLLHREAVRPLLALASLVPLALAVGALATSPPPAPAPVERAAAQSEPGASTRWCPGPLQLPDEALETGPDEELAVTPPNPDVSLRTVAVEPASSLLFGTVSGSSTLQEDDGSVRAPSIAVEGADGAVLEDAPA